MLVAEQDMTSYLFHIWTSLVYRLYRCIVMKYFRYVSQHTDYHRCQHESDFGDISRPKGHDYTRIYPTIYRKTPITEF